MHNRNVAAYHAARLQQQQQNRMKTMSMSTGSDRETSSVGSLSPTMTHAKNQCNFYVDQPSPTGVFTYSFSPSNSPSLTDNAPVSPTPLIVEQLQQQQQHHHHQQSFIDQPHGLQQIPEDARLPIFNRISCSSAVDSLSALTI